MTANCTNTVYTAPSHTKPWTGFGWVFEILAVQRSRRDLAEIDDHILRDVGITRPAALQEAGRAFWDAPAHWRL